MWVKKCLRWGLKLACTVGFFYFLLQHPIEQNGISEPVWRALVNRAGSVRWQVALPFLLLAAASKGLGIACAIGRWLLLLRGQGLRFKPLHVVGTFFIGRFLGTFLPGTLGLDGYKLYDAIRFSGRRSEAVWATVAEKGLGLSGILATYLIFMPWGSAVLGDHASTIVLLTVPLCVGVIGTTVTLMCWPEEAAILLRRVGSWLPFTQRILAARLPKADISASADSPVHPDSRANAGPSAWAAYARHYRLIASCLLLSVGVHAATALVYYWTALAIGVIGAPLWEVLFASSIQILATVLSPLTIAGEGVREAVQALLLARSLGATNSILSAALGFWAAEALTLIGAVWWWRRPHDYQTTVVLAARG